MKTSILFSIFAILIFSSSILADIAPPPDYKETREVRIEVSKDYPDYTFYLCSYISILTNPSAIRPKQIYKMDESTFQMVPLELTTQKPFSRDAQEYHNWHLVAVRKDFEEQNKSLLREKLINAIKSEKNEDGLYVAQVDRYSGSEKGAYVVINKVESLDGSGLKIEAVDGNGSGRCFGLFLILGAAFGATWIFRKKKRIA